MAFSNSGSRATINKKQYGQSTWRKRVPCTRDLRNLNPALSSLCPTTRSWIFQKARCVLFRLSFPRLAFHMSRFVTGTNPPLFSHPYIQLDGQRAFMTGKLKTKGNAMLATKLTPLLEVHRFMCISWRSLIPYCFHPTLRFALHRATQHGTCICQIAKTKSKL